MDPRVGEIEDRLNAATPGPWKANKDGTIDGTDYAEVICRGQVDCMSYCYGGTSVIEGDNLAADAEFIAHAPSDVAYLLAELRKRDEALARVEGVHEPIDALMYSGPHQRLVKVCTGCGSDDGNWQHWPCPTLKVITAAVGDAE